MKKRYKFHVIPLLLIFFILAACYGSKKTSGHNLRDLSRGEQKTDDGWDIVSPGSAGMNAVALEALLTYIDKSGYDIHSLTIVRGGKIVMDCYGTNWKYDRPIKPEDLHELHSVTKSFTSILIGIAMGEGLIPGVDVNPARWFSESEIGLADKNREALTLEDILTMRSGLSWQEGPDYRLFDSPEGSAVAVLSQPMSEEPGTLWNYSSGNSAILGEILRRATGKTPEEYAVEKLFTPLEITRYTWVKDAAGTNHGGWGLSLRPRDMARFGQLCLQKGVWNGKTVIPENYLAEAVRSRCPTPWAGGDYGWHWWVPSFGGFAARGYQGQAIYVLPELDMVVVFTSLLDSNQADAILDNLMRDYILTAVMK